MSLEEDEIDKEDGILSLVNAATEFSCRGTGKGTAAAAVTSADASKVAGAGKAQKVSPEPEQDDAARYVWRMICSQSSYQRSPIGTISLCSAVRIASKHDYLCRRIGVVFCHVI